MSRAKDFGVSSLSDGFLVRLRSRFLGGSDVNIVSCLWAGRVLARVEGGRSNLVVVLLVSMSDGRVGEEEEGRVVRWGCVRRVIFVVPLALVLVRHLGG